MRDPLRLLRVSDSSEFLLLGATPGEAADEAAGWAKSGLVVRRVRGGKMSTKSCLFDEFAAALQFPWYFGENWDAFDECLRDLSWLPAHQGYVIVVTDADRVLTEDTAEQLAFLVRSLTNAWGEWRRPVAAGEWWDRPAMSFHVVLQDAESSAHRIAARWGSAGAVVAWY